MGSLLREITLAPRALPPIAGALLQLALALFLVAAPGAARERAVRSAFAVVALCASLWSLFTAVALATVRPAVAQVAIQGSLAAIALAGPVSFDFAVRILRVKNRWLLPVELFAASVAASLFLFPSLLQVTERASGGFWPGPSLGFFLVVTACLPSVTAGFFILFFAARALPPSRRRRQLSWAAAALAFGGLGGLDVDTVFDHRYPVGWFTCTLSCATLFYAVLQYRLLAIRGVVQRAAVTLVALGALAGWLAPLAAFSRGVTPVFIAGWVLVGFAGMRLWASQLAPAVARLFDARRRRMELALTEFERRALDARSGEDVVSRLGRTVEEALGARLVSLIPPGEAPPLAAPALRDLLDLDAPDAPAVLAALDRLAADALVPITHAGENLGAAALAGGAMRAADDDLAELLGRLGEAAGRAFTSARLYQEVARRSAGLEAQVRLRTAELENALGELTAAQAKLAEAERSSSLGLLVAGVSHEINNALNFISANLPTLGRYLKIYDQVLTASPEVARVTAARKAAPETVAQLGEAMRRTSAIVEDLRRFVRPDTERRLFRVTEGLDAALNLLRRRTDGRIDVVRSYAGPGMVEGYPGPLNQCFFNLLLNAVDAARGEIWVAVQDGDSGVEVVIRDDGEGVPGELTDLVFQPFFTTRPTAAGLGLTVSRAIVERHGGTLALASPTDGGVQVRVRLPSRAPEIPT